MKKLPGMGEAREAVLLYHKVTRGQAGTNQCSWGVMREMTAEEQLCPSTVNGKVRVHRECMDSIHSHVSLGRLGADTGVSILGAHLEGGCKARFGWGDAVATMVVRLLLP